MARNHEKEGQPQGPCRHRPEHSSLPDRHGSLRVGELLGTEIPGNGAYGDPDSSPVCEALRPDEQERLERAT